MNCIQREIKSTTSLFNPLTYGVENLSLSYRMMVELKSYCFFFIRYIYSYKTFFVTSLKT